LDRSRPVSPLVAAPDAHVIDSSSLTAQQVADEIERIVNAAAGR